MKYLFGFNPLFLFLILQMSLPIWGQQNRHEKIKGNEGSGGGAFFAAEFSFLGYNAVSSIKKIPNFPIKPQQFKRVVESTIVEFTRDILRDGNGLEVDAQNFPYRKLIRVNYNRWDKMQFSPLQKLQLVIHEYLGILKINDSGYRVSKLILDGGVKIKELNCKILYVNNYQGELSFYTLDKIDTSNENSSDTNATFTIKSQKEKINIRGPVVVGLIEKNGKLGYSFTWSFFVTQMAFIRLDQIEAVGEFNIDLYSITEFDINGLPSLKRSGKMSCKNWIN